MKDTLCDRILTFGFGPLYDDSDLGECIKAPVRMAVWTYTAIWETIAVTAGKSLKNCFCPQTLTLLGPVTEITRRMEELMSKYVYCNYIYNREKSKAIQMSDKPTPKLIKA